MKTNIKTTLLLAVTAVNLSIKGSEARIGGTLSKHVATKPGNTTNSNTSMDFQITNSTMLRFSNDRALSIVTQTCQQAGWSPCWPTGTHVVTAYGNCASCFRSGQYRDGDCSSSWPSRAPLIQYCGFDYQTPDIVGGDGGDDFDDRGLLSLPQINEAKLRVTRVVMRTGDLIDSITTHYSNRNDPIFHGTAGGSSTTELVLSEGEFITDARICITEQCIVRSAIETGACDQYADLVTHVRLSTSEGNFQDFGRYIVHERCQTFDVGGDSQIIGWRGRSGNYVDALGVLTTRR